MSICKLGLMSALCITWLLILQLAAGGFTPVLPAGEVEVVAWSSDGRWLAAGLRRSDTIIWNTDTWESRTVPHAASGDIWNNAAIQWQPDSDVLAIATADAVAFVSATSGVTLRRLPSEDLVPRVLAWHPRGIQIVATHPWLLRDSLKRQHGLSIWDVSSGRLMWNWEPSRCAAWSPSGDRFAHVDTKLGNRVVIEAWGSGTGSPPLVMNADAPADAGETVWFDWHPSGSRIVTIDRVDGRRRVAIWDAFTGELCWVKPVSDGVLYDLLYARWSPAGDRILITFSRGPSQIWDAQGAFQSSVPGRRAASWSPNGRWVASASADVRSVLVVDIESGEIVQELRVEELDARSNTHDGRDAPKAIVEKGGPG